MRCSPSFAMLAWLTFLFTKTIKIRSRKSGSVSNSAEIFAVLRTAYRVFFENSQIFGAACRNERKFLPAVWEHAETGGNCRSTTHCLPIFLRKLARAFWKSTKTRSLYSLHKQSPRVCGRKSHIKRRSVKDPSVYFLRGVDFPALRSNLRFRASCTTTNAEFLRSLI